MTKQKLFELAEKINTFMVAELKNESVADVAAAMIIALSYQASASKDYIVLPEKICKLGLIEINKVQREG